MDFNGNLSGSCTTSGAGFKMRGRVGDSPIIGAGLYVDNEVGACVATGQGRCDTGSRFALGCRNDATGPFARGSL
jgi:isoaspartyl peptidase/L-asparaginase-like protein (Ntn-hydrolase superfamily)